MPTPNDLLPRDTQNPSTGAVSPHPLAPKPSIAWDVSADDRNAVRDDELLTVNLDLQAAAISALGSYDEIRALRDQAAALPGFDVSLIDKLPVYASAAMQAQSLYQGSAVETQELQQLYARANELRDLLYTEVLPLTRRRLVSLSEIKDYKGAFGYRIAVADLLLLTNTLRRYQQKAPGDERVPVAEIEEAEALANELAHAVGRKEQGPAVTAAAALDRQRACTLFVRTYDAVRRAVSYLRWREGDVDTIAPSLYAHQNRSAKRRDGASTDDSAPMPTPPAVVGARESTSGTDLNPFAS